jgi:hypothetical protein
MLFATSFTRLLLNRFRLSVLYLRQEGSDQCRILYAAFALYSGRQVDFLGSAQVDCLGNVVHIQSTRKHERLLQVKIFQKCPVKRNTITARDV